MLIAQGAIDACKLGVTIALRYSASRPQFGAKLILDYLTHQRRLMPALAATYAHHLAMAGLKDVFCARRPQDAKLVHVMSSGLKAAATWSRVEVGGRWCWCCGAAAAALAAAAARNPCCAL
jgi:acyl-CoA oxidase